MKKLIEKFRQLKARAKVVLTALPTYLTAASAAISIGAPWIADAIEDLPEIDKVFPGETVTMWAARLVGWLGAAVVLIQRVKRVPKAEQGLLPKPPGGV